MYDGHLLKITTIPQAKCPTCGEEDNLHVCLPVVIQMLKDSSEFQELVKAAVAEKLAIIGELDEKKELRCFVEASRLAHWIRDFSTRNSPELVADIKAVLAALDDRYPRIWEQQTHT